MGSFRPPPAPPPPPFPLPLLLGRGAHGGRERMPPIPRRVLVLHAWGLLRRLGRTGPTRRRLPWPQQNEQDKGRLEQGQEELLELAQPRLMAPPPLLQLHQPKQRLALQPLHVVVAHVLLAVGAARVGGRAVRARRAGRARKAAAADGAPKRAVVRERVK